MAADETMPAPLSDAEIAAIDNHYRGYYDEPSAAQWSEIRERLYGKMTYLEYYDDAPLVVVRLLATLAAYRSAIADIISAFERAHIEMTNDNWNQRKPVDQALARARALLGTPAPGTTGATGATAGEDREAPE